MNVSPIPDESKIILIGDQAVGKTSILNQLNDQQSTQEYNPTVGASFISKDINTDKGNVTLHIWDTAGQERYRSLIPLYARNAVAALVVFDVTKKESYSHLYNIWVDQVLSSSDNQVKIYIIANKMDQEPAFDINNCQSEAEEYGYQFFKISAFNHKQVEEIFNTVAEDISKNERFQNPKEEASRDQEKSNGCC